MSTHGTCGMAELAPAFGLGALDGTDLERFESHLLDGCDACARELGEADRVVDLLALAAEPSEPPPSLRARLMREIAGVPEPEPARGADDFLAAGDWKPHAVPGVSTRVLRVEQAARQVLMLVRAAPGVRYPPHRHAGTEELLMLSGELDIGGRVYGAGEFLVSQAGSVHPPSYTADGCMFLIRTSLDDVPLV